MHLALFGATSSTGRLVVEHGLTAGHTMTVLTRDAAKVTTRHDRLRVVEGDATVADDCRIALDGADSVIVTLGNGRRGAVREAGTRAVVAAMRAAGVRRLVCQSTLGVGASRDNLNLVWRHLMFGLLLREVYADHVRQEEVVMTSGLDWTIVRPGAFTDPEVPGVRHGFGGHEPGLTFKVSRGQVAEFLLDQVAREDSVHRAISLSA